MQLSFFTLGKIQNSCIFVWVKRFLCWVFWLWVGCVVIVATIVRGADCNNNSNNNFSSLRLI